MNFAFAPQTTEAMPNVFDRVKIIWRLLTQKHPEIPLTPHSKVKFGENKIYFDGDFHLESSGSLYLSAKKHIVIESGQDPEPGRPGYRHSVWINSQKDSFGRPLKHDDVGGTF